MALSEAPSLILCSICFNSKEGRQPRILSCVHSFCDECLKEWHNECHSEARCARTEVECPTCRTIMALPSGDISSLSKDINVQQFADYMKKGLKISCQVCNIKRGTSACVTCSVLICEDCGKKHKESPLFASHVLSRDICELHGWALQGGCTTCSIGVCLRCVHEDLHKNHSLEDIPSGIKKLRQILTECTGNVEELVKLGNLREAETRKYIRQFKCTQGIKEGLHRIKMEVQRLEKRCMRHERLCEAKVDNMFKEYAAQRKQATGAISRGYQLLREEGAGFLHNIKSSDVPNEEMCCLLRDILSSIPDFNSISVNKCRLEHLETALESLRKCKLVCGIPKISTKPVGQTLPKQVIKVDCGEGCDIEYPWRLFGTPEGDAVVCDDGGWPVYKVYKDGAKARLHDDGTAACVHNCDLYMINAEGDTVTQIKQDGSTANHKLKQPIPSPKGLAVSDNNVFVLSFNAINKQSLFDQDCCETFCINGCENLSHILKTNHQGKTKLVVTDWVTAQVIICDTAGALLTRFGAA